MIPYLLTALGSYLIGSSVKQYADGGQVQLLAPNGKPSASFSRQDVAPVVQLLFSLSSRDIFFWLRSYYADRKSVV
jgi:hypothetical protein